METEKHIPKKYCSQKWENMKLSENEKVRFCEQCAKNIFDIRHLSHKEVDDLYEAENKSMCVLASPHQRKRVSLQKSKIRKVLRKISLVYGLVLASYTQQNLQAQTSNYRDKNFKIVQEETQSDSIIIEGIIKRKRRILGRKKLDTVSVSVYVYNEQGNKIKLKELQSQENGVFRFILSKKELEGGFSLNFWDEETYSSYNTERIALNHTKISVFYDRKPLSIFPGKRYTCPGYW